ncbi:MULTISPECIES: segregation and condensation protein A [Olivibacter]|jgi:segregation and condensation protein A|uniref:Segregation and condensation protein A n=1 Tax=Olivibacter oleidegradans TaxID=760123 RepID=A0ABV6HEB8_9SPHI|nr:MULTISPECIES: segregation/condensation protein A [Olivibacter]QEK99737.1 chromosome segregation protein ScpA [Olivibacter sp. LS-1]
MQTEGFEIKLPQFEGPFDLLLFFIERDELNIHEISIAKITDDFLGYIHHMNALNMELASEFIFVAATLMRIKAKMLLPRPEIDEDGNEIDLKKDLVQKLIEYKKFKTVCEDLKALEDNRFMVEKRGNIAFNLKIAANEAEPGEELNSFDLYKLMKVYDRLMNAYLNKSNEVKHTVVQYPYTIEQQKKTIASLLTINQKLDFKAIQQHSENRVHFVYNFLAILEMLQQQILEIQLGLGYNNFWVQEKAQAV